METLQIVGYLLLVVGSLGLAFGAALGKVTCDGTTLLDKSTLTLLWLGVSFTFVEAILKVVMEV